MSSKCSRVTSLGGHQISPRGLALIRDMDPADRPVVRQVRIELARFVLHGESERGDVSVRVRDDRGDDLDEHEVAWRRPTELAERRVGARPDTAESIPEARLLIDAQVDSRLVEPVERSTYVLCLVVVDVE